MNIKSSANKRDLQYVSELSMELGTELERDWDVTATRLGTKHYETGQK